MMKKINIVGTSGSGKTTFARQLAQELNLTYIELDDLFWMDDWQQTPDDEFLKKIKNVMAQSVDGYVIDGNYTRTIHLTWQELDTVIWLDLPFYLNLYQSIKRALYRTISNKPMWQNSNNTESFQRMLSRDSIIFWMMKTHQKNRKKYQDRMKNPDYAHIHFIHLRSRRQIQKFLEKIN